MPMAERYKGRCAGTPGQFVPEDGIDLFPLSNIVVEKDGQEPATGIEGIPSLCWMKDIFPMKARESRHTVPDQWVVLNQDNIFHIWG